VKPRISGLYAVTPDLADTAELLAKVEAALAGGARVLQYRNKSASAALRLEQARTLLARCRERRVPLIINDDLDLATALDADGLHLGSEDGALAAARLRLGPGKLLGASCYNRLDHALAAARDGADYVAFGSFFPSSVKPGAVHAPLALLREAKQRLALPVVAIGGITLDHARQLIAAGADGVAVISALFGAPDIRAAARQFDALFLRS
jgi:thiamine-phosphate pyrophosphorylase